MNQRLVLLAADFLEATKDVDHYEMFKWRSNLTTVEKEDRQNKVSQMITIIKQLFKKYQLEIIRPNLDYVINKY